MKLVGVKNIVIPNGNVKAIHAGGTLLWSAPMSNSKYTWEAVAASIENGTYATDYAVGDTIPLDLGSEGIINMQIAAFDADDASDGSGKVPISWIGVELLKTSKRWNSDIQYVYDYKEQTATTSTNNNSSVSANSLKQTNFRYYIQAGEEAEITNVINVTADGTLTITYKGVSASYGTLDVLVNDETIVSDYASTTSVAYTMDVVSGDVVTVVARYASVAVTNNYAYVSFKSTGTFKITTSCNNVISRYTAGYVEGTGSIGGWERSELRKYYNETLLPLIPEEVRSRIVSVKKEQTACDTAGKSFTQTTDELVWPPSYPEIFGSSSLYKVLFENINANRVKYKVGSLAASWWWLRSASDYVSSYFVGTDGSNASYLGAGNSGGLALGFCTR